jgi:hypothetical protein
MTDDEPKGPLARYEFGCSAIGATHRSDVSREPSGHRPSRNLSGSAVRDRDPTIRDYFFKKNYRVTPRPKRDSKWRLSNCSWTSAPP